MQVPFRRELNTEYADSGYSMLNITQNITHKIIAEIADISSVTLASIENIYLNVNI